MAVEVVMETLGRGPGWTTVFKIRHEYNAAGRRVSVTTQSITPTGMKDTARQVFAYDADGNQIETRHQGPRDGGWTDGRKETWTYERQRP